MNILGDEEFKKRNDLIVKGDFCSGRNLGIKGR